MRTYKEVKEKVEYTCERIDSTTCDLCGKEGKNGTSSPWAGDYPNVNDVEISLRAGSRKGKIKVTRFDVCPECFENKLVSWFREQGAEPGGK